MTLDLASLLIGFFVGVVVMLVIYTRSRGAVYETQIAELMGSMKSMEAALAAAQQEAADAQKELKEANRELKKAQRAADKADQLAADLETANGQIGELESQLSACEAQVAELESQTAVVEPEAGAELAEPQPSVLSAADEGDEAADEGISIELPREPKPKDLQIVEGIGPKIADLLIAAGIYDLADLAEAAVDKLNEVLEAAGSRYRLADPSTWPAQAALGAKGDMDALQKLQDSLKGGRLTE